MDAYGLCGEREHGRVLRRRAGLDVVWFECAAELVGDYGARLLVWRRVRTVSAISVRIGAESGRFSQFQTCAHIRDHDAEYRTDPETGIARCGGTTGPGRARGRGFWASRVGGPSGSAVPARQSSGGGSGANHLLRG